MKRVFVTCALLVAKCLSEQARTTGGAYDQLFTFSFKGLSPAGGRRLMRSYPRSTFQYLSW